jgi:hypothetical protein
VNVWECLPSSSKNSTWRDKVSSEKSEREREMWVGVGAVPNKIVGMVRKTNKSNTDSATPT